MKNKLLLILEILRKIRNVQKCKRKSTVYHVKDKIPTPMKQDNYLIQLKFIADILMQFFKCM